MKVRTAERNITASVFWDSGCTSNFIRDEFARKCGFRGKEVTLSVTTLGGVITDYFLRNENGELQSFDA